MVLSEVKKLKNSKFKTLIKMEQWQNNYFVELAIFDHLEEVRLLKQKYRLNKIADNLNNYEKELTDLFILLSMWIKDEPELLDTRLNRFLKNAKKN